MNDLPSHDDEAAETSDLEGGNIGVGECDQNFLPLPSEIWAEVLNCKYIHIHVSYIIHCVHFLDHCVF